MHITLNKFLQELESLSPSAFSQIENLYPLEFNVEISSLAKFSISLNHEKQTFNLFENLNPSFSLQLDIFTVLNALNKKQVPTKSNNLRSRRPWKKRGNIENILKLPF